MDNNERLEQRMYVLVERHLSPLDKGIQAAHAVAQYCYGWGGDNNDEFIKWVAYDKTLVLLDGGTLPELEALHTRLKNIDVRCSAFVEPDLGDMVTAVAFLADERVFDCEKYLPFEKWLNTKCQLRIDLSNALSLGKMLPNQDGLYKEWLEYIGGIRIAEIKEIVNNRRLAR